MNPKSVNDLDPKLKETYERVMGTSLGQKPTTAPAPTMETQPVIEPQPQPTTDEQKPEPQLQVETPTISTNEDTTVSQVFRADSKNEPAETATVNPPSPKSEAAAKKSGNKLLPIVIVGGVMFLAIYAVIWAKVFGLF